MEKETDLSPQESLELISKMITRARGSYNKISFYFLWWGSLWFIQGIVDYIALSKYESNYGSIGYGIVGIIGGFGSVIYTKKQNKSIIKSDLDSIYMWMWGSYLGTLFAILIICLLNKQYPNAFIMILTGLPTMFTGLITKFKPFVLGGLAFWVLGIVASNFARAEMSLIYSLSILTGYLIPGILLKLKEKSGI